MNIHNFKIFDKKGSFINWYRDSYIQIDFTTDTTNAIAAEAFAITDPNALITEIIIENSGYNYNPLNTSALLTYTFDTTGSSTILTNADVSINFIDVSIFNPEPTNTQAIGSVDVSVNDTPYIYPAVSYSGALFLNPVSKGLIETEHLTILEENLITGVFSRPYDPESSLIFRFVSEDTEIKLFELDTNTQEVIWTDEVIFNTNILAENIPITLNIGFKAEEEGVYERRLRIYELRDNIEYILGEFLVNAQAIAQDERYDIILQNLAPTLNPKDFPKLFKGSDINEDLPDWKLLNQKGKNAVLDYSHITPYIGTYKALVNSIKWLGYEDLKIKEWFKDVKHNKKLALDIPYDAKERANTILYFSAEERQNLKKLNELSLIYQFNRETGELDKWGTPIVENVYEYNIKEILIKLSALKIWLEKNIIGVNTRITDITGEGVYFEQFKNLIYGVQKHGIDAIFEQKITPITLANNSELIAGDSSIRLSLLELEQTKIKDLNYNFRSILTYGYNHDTSLNADGIYTVIPTDSSLINDFSAPLIRVGPTFKFPFKDLNDIMWKAHIRDKSAGVLGNRFVTNPLFIYENEIRYYDTIKDESTFYDVSSNTSLVIEKAFFRDPSNDIWGDEQIMYEVYPDPSIIGNYFLESSLGIITSFTGFAIFNVLLDGSSSLTYSVDKIFKVPLLKFKNYSITDGSGNYNIFESGKELILDIIDGKISMDASLLNSTGQMIYETNHINFTNNLVLVDQKITLNTEFTSGRISLSQYDPSEYFYQQEELKSDPISALVIDNSIYNLEVNHIGDYAIELFSWDSWNTNYYNPYYSLEGDSSTYEVWTKFPHLISVVESSIAGIDPSTYSILDVDTAINTNINPIFDREIHLQNLALRLDNSGNEYLEVPSITFFQDVPKSGSISKIYNLTEQATGKILIDSSSFVFGSVANYPWWDVAYGNGIWVAVAADDLGTIASSDDGGVTWTLRPHAITTNLRWAAITYGNGQFVAVAQESTRIGTSPDGINWTEQTPAIGSGLSSDIVYGNGIYVILETIDVQVTWSYDAITWYSAPIPAVYPHTTRTITFGNDTFVIVGSAGKAFNSIDASNWYSSDLPVGNINMGSAFGNGTFVALASADFTDMGMNSVDGSVWFTNSVDSSNAWRGVTYGDGVFVAVASDSIDSTNQIMTSSDGSIWVAGASQPGTASYINIGYGDGFVAVADSSIITSVRTALTIDPDFMSFNTGDDVNMVLFDKGKYSAAEQYYGNIVNINNDNQIVISPAPPSYWLFDVSTSVFIRNTTERSINRDIGDPSIRYSDGILSDYMVVNVSDYTFSKNQLVAFIIKDVCTGFEMGASYKVIDSSTTSTSKGFEHVFKGRISDYILDDASRYNITAKHTFDQYFSTQLDVTAAFDVSNNFLIYHDDPFYTQNYMDNTFTYVNIPFDQEEVLRQWGENSQYNMSGYYYSYNQFIDIDVSSLLILNAVYDASGYMLDQKNIWTVHNTSNNKLIMKVWNNQLVYVFDEIGRYNIKGESYDSFGNLKDKIFEGMITVS